MAYTKKTQSSTVKKKATEDVNATESTVKESVVETVQKTETETVKEVKTTPVKVKKTFDNETPIPCTSITAGELGMLGIKSGINYTWAGRGDVTDVEYQDLVAAIRSGKKHITEPYFIINDDDFLEEYPQVKKIYGEIYSIGDLRKVITDLDPQSMRLTIESLPNGAKESIKNIASTMIANHQIDSIDKIKVLDKIYDTKFMLMTELFD